MKTPLLLVLSLASAYAATLTGNWMAIEHRPDGTEQPTYFDLSAHDGRITGTVRNRSVEFVVLSSTGTPERFTLKVGPKDGNMRWGREYSGSLVGDELHLTTLRAPEADRAELVAHRVAADAGGPPAKITPPALHPVPPNHLAQTPPMGWNSWNKFAGKVTDAGVRSAADAMVANGMKDAGYLYVNIDDTWQGNRDSQGFIHANKKFPDMKALTDYIHSKGLKAGLYSSPGPSTCAGYDGSYGHETQDAQTYAQWGFDYLKYDWCSAARVYQPSDMQAVYQKMGDALAASGRPIVFSLCQYGLDNVWNWGPQVSGNLWRTTGDIADSWASMSKIGFGQADLAPYAAPGHWNDPDMLEIGNGGMTDTEYQTHMSLWCLLAAPLLAGNDLDHMSPSIHAILTNREAIALDQDPLGKQARRTSQSGEQEVWTKDLSGGAKAVGLFNRASAAAPVSVRWSEVGLSGTPKTARDLWLHRAVQLSGDEFHAEVPAHGVVLLKVQ